MIFKIIGQLSIPVFVIGCLVIIFSYYPTHKSQGVSPDINATFNSPDVKVIFKQEKIYKDGSTPPKLVSKIVRLQKADGSWKKTITDYDQNGLPARPYIQYAINGRGIFQVSEKHKKLFLLGDRPGPPRKFSAEGVKKTADFVREEDVAGYKTIVTRLGSNPVDYSELYHAPDFNGLMLKWDIIYEEYTSVIEAVEVKIEPITPEEFGELPDYPIDYSGYEKSY